MSIEHPRFFITKTETDAIGATKVLCLTLLDVMSGEALNFADQPGYPSIADGVKMAVEADGLITHSPFAIKTLARLYGADFDKVRLIDTLAEAKTRHPHLPNGLSEWAKRLGQHRANFRGADNWTSAIQQHCEHDARIIRDLFWKLEGVQQ